VSHCARCSHEARILAAAPISPGRFNQAKSGAQPASVGSWTLDIGHWTLDVGRWSRTHLSAAPDLSLQTASPPALVLVRSGRTARTARAQRGGSPWSAAGQRSGRARGGSTPASRAVLEREGAMALQAPLGNFNAARLQGIESVRGRSDTRTLLLAAELESSTDGFDTQKPSHVLVMALRRVLVRTGLREWR
jgi:hypothetical protein